MLKSALAYLNFWRKSIHLHGIHSPFVFKLQQLCIKDHKKYPEYNTLDQHRRALINKQEAIAVTDLGAGSRVFNSDVRSIRSIAKNAGISKSRQRLLFRLCRFLTVNNALELGTSLGMGSLAIHLARPDSGPTTVEGCPNTAQVAQSGWEQLEVEGINLQRQSFEDFYQELEDEVYDLIYLDGDHSLEGTLNAFEQLINHTHEDTVMIFDDIYWSADMTQAWDRICRDPRVSISIDTFGWGLVFFKQDREKEHFYLRV